MGEAGLAGAAGGRDVLVTARDDGRRRVVVATSVAAEVAGLRPGMAMAQALAIVPGLRIIEAELVEDAAALLRLALWCHRVTPLAAVDGLDGIWLDISGCAHLWGGEGSLLAALMARFAGAGLQARMALADTPGAAHGVARHGTGSDRPWVIVPPGAQAAGMADLPVAALRMAPELVATLRRLGFERVGHLERVPRGLLARRFGALPGLRLDQAHGQMDEPLRPLRAEHRLQNREVFLEPLITAECLAVATAHLMGPLCEEMERCGVGARQIDLVFERIDGQSVAVQIGTARPSRDSGHLVRLLTERLESVDPGLGVEAMHLLVPLAEPLAWEQRDSQAREQDVSRLIDRLSNRLGEDRLYRVTARESALPERSTCDVAATAVSEPTGPGAVAGAAVQVAAVRKAMKTGVRVGASPPSLALVSSGPGPAERAEDTGLPHLRLVEASASADLVADLADPEHVAWTGPWSFRRLSRAAGGSGPRWPERLHPPARLLDPPRAVETIAALRDCPPIAFTWRRRRHRICRADGPERVGGEWWRQGTELAAVRDYYHVEDETGQRFWLFRRGNGLDRATGDLSWYLHGLF